MSEAKERGQKGTITIKGVDKEVYRAFVSLAKLMGKTTGELATEAFKLYLSVMGLFGGAFATAARAIKGLGDMVERMAFQTIGGFEALEVDRSMLEVANRPLLFMDIGRLVIKPDVDEGLIEEKVFGIIDCDVVELPPGLPRASVLRKCRFVRKVVVSGEEGGPS